MAEYNNPYVLTVEGKIVFLFRLYADYSYRLDHLNHFVISPTLKKGKYCVFKLTKVKLVKATQFIYILFVNMV